LKSHGERKEMVHAASPEAGGN